MTQFKTRRAAHAAMITAAFLAERGITRIWYKPTGEVQFKKLGVIYTLYPDGKVAYSPERVRAQVADEAHIPTDAAGFAKRGDVWNARNEQVTTYRPFGARVRTNAFGDLTDHPAVDGYDGWEKSQSHDRGKYLALVRDQELAVGAPSDARKLFQARWAHRHGK